MLRVGCRNLVIVTVQSISKSVLKRLLLIMKQLRITSINLLRSYLMKTLILNKFANTDETAQYGSHVPKKSSATADERTSRFKG